MEILDNIENIIYNPDSDCKYLITDETDFFKKLVNFSQSHGKPYHQWAKYREGFSDELVTELINRSGIDSNIHYVVDPMCGSGSTLISALKNGYSALGLDVNPYSIFLTNIKLQKYSDNQLIEVKTNFDQILSDFVNLKINIRDINDCRKYFIENNYNDLFKLKYLISEIKDDTIRNLFFTVWLCILEDCSERKKDGNGLATRPTKVKSVTDCFRTKFLLVYSDIINEPHTNFQEGNSFAISANKLSDIAKDFSKHINKHPGVVIFSPPYANSFDYFESYKIELLFGEFCDLKGLKLLRELAIRNYRMSLKSEPIIENLLLDRVLGNICESIPIKEKLTGKRDDRTRIMAKVLKAYFLDMENVLIEIFKTLTKNGKCYIVVDQSAYVGVIVPTDIIIAELAEKNGFKVNKIIKCRRANTSGQQTKQYPHLKNLRESIVELEKV